MPYIIHDDTAIWATGETEAEAWEDFAHEMKMGNVVLPERDDFTACRATLALVKRVRDCGGAIAWGATPDGLACTTDEEDGANQ